MDTVQEVKAPTGNSAAAGLRKLRRYAADPQICTENDINQKEVIEQFLK